MSEPNYAGSFLNLVGRILLNFRTARSTWISLGLFFLCCFGATGFQLVKYTSVALLVTAGILLALFIFVWCIYSLITESDFREDMRATGVFLRRAWGFVNYNALTVILFTATVCLMVCSVDFVFFGGHMYHILATASSRVLRLIFGFALFFIIIQIIFEMAKSGGHKKKKGGH